jgi:hypothetical protein
LEQDLSSESWRALQEAIVSFEVATARGTYQNSEVHVGINYGQGVDHDMPIVEQWNSTGVVEWNEGWIDGEKGETRMRWGKPFKFFYVVPNNTT